MPGTTRGLLSFVTLAGALQAQAPRALAPVAPPPWPPVATFSILAMDPATGEIGAAVQSRVFSVRTGVLASEGTWRPARGATALAARAGYAFRGTGDDRSPLTLGGGVTLGRFAVDYAYEGFELLGVATHRVGVRFIAPPRDR